MPMILSQEAKTDLKLGKLQEDHKQLNKKYKEALKYVSYCEQQLELAYKASKVSRTKAPERPARTRSTNEATVVSILSDVHCEAVVNAKSVNGLNKYNPEIARKRLQTYAERVVRLTDKERQDINISKAVIHFGGDMINNSLHADDKLTNAMTVQEAVLFCDELLTEVLEFIVAHGSFNKIDVVCSVGNHGRSLTKMPTGEAAYRTSYEYIIYRNLARKFSSEPSLKFHLPESYFSYLKVYNKLLRFSHGDAYTGTADSISKHFDKANSTLKADHDFVGHWHFLTPAPTYTKNGCVIGTTPYVLQKGYGHQEPMQSFQLLDNKRGFTISAPIFLNN